MSYRKPVDHLDDVYCSYKSQIISFATANTTYPIITLPYGSDRRFYPEQAVAYFYEKSNIGDQIDISIGWRLPDLVDWTQSSPIGVSSADQGWFQEFSMTGTTYQTGQNYRRAAPGGTVIYAKAGDKTGSTMKLIISIDGYWTGSDKLEFP